ncbi:hypothetical protein C0J52_00934 [Blattella germanica]|nr:hypothetical protein C0J52_00934 [Blattella germanica]
MRSLTKPEVFTMQLRSKTKSLEEEKIMNVEYRRGSSLSIMSIEERKNSLIYNTDEKSAHRMQLRKRMSTQDYLPMRTRSGKHSSFIERDFSFAEVSTSSDKNTIKSSLKRYYSAMKKSVRFQDPIQEVKLMFLLSPIVCSERKTRSDIFVA